MVDGPSGTSLGSSQFPTNTKHRMACFEQAPGSSFPIGSYFYGIGLTTLGASAGLGIWGGTIGNLTNQDGVTGTVDPHMNVCSNGRVGINQNSPAYTLDVTGDIHATGTISVTLKPFDIPHESKPDMRLLHYCTESDSVGGNLIYKRKINACAEGITDLIMPDWFVWLARNVMIFGSGDKHFGQC